MVEFTVPALVAEPTTGNASSTVVRHAAQTPELVLFSRLIDRYSRWGRDGLKPESSEKTS